MKCSIVATWVGRSSRKPKQLRGSGPGIRKAAFVMVRFSRLRGPTGDRVGVKDSSSDMN